VFWLQAFTTDKKIQAPSAECGLLDWDDHVMPIYLPAYSPELNSIKRLWEHTKKDLKWENYSSLDKIKEQVNRIIKFLTNEEVLSLCGWDYILEAILSATS
jgi:transposase